MDGWLMPEVRGDRKLLLQLKFLESAVIRNAKKFLVSNLKSLKYKKYSTRDNTTWLIIIVRQQRK